ncbi:hypothetical protein Tco_0910883 [Tanacetum coccineum]|uniref:Reverse transcriptase domain-containing protein n=1 Tax=Tanacetum coccineum TaxID=301880 RepID=A0ABQ5CUK4_9ASTR
MKTQQAVLMNQQNVFQTNLQNMLSGFFQNQASTSGTLPSNTIPNPKGEMKAITTRSSVAYEGPSIPTNPSPKKVVERATEEITDKEQNNFQGSTAHILPSVNPILILEPDVPKTLPKPNIPYPSRRNDQKDALLLMPRFSHTIKSLLMNKEKLLELAKIPLNENCSAMLLKKLPKKLGDPVKFLIPCDFLGMDHPQKHANESIKMNNSIDVSCKDSFGEVLRLKKTNHFLSGSTTSLSDSSPSLTSFETSDSLLEEFADELALLDPFPPGNEDVDVEAELRKIELLLNRDPSINFSPMITIDPNHEKFTDEFAPTCLPLPGDDESFLKEDVEEENFQVYANPLFEYDDNYKSRGDNDEIDAFLAIEISTYIEEGYYDSEGDIFYLEKLLIDDTTHNLFPKVLFDHEPQCFKDESEFDTLKNMVKIFDPGIWEKTFSPSCVRLSSKDHHYLLFTIVVQILFTYHVNFLFSFGREDTIFDPGIFAFHFSSQEPVAVKCSMEFCFSTCFISMDE